MIVEAPLIIFDNIVDSQGEIFEASGVEYPDKISVSKNGSKQPMDILAVGDLFQRENALMVKFDLPTKRLPEFSLYASFEGKILDEEVVNGARLIKKCKIDWICISTQGNSDPRTGRLKTIDE